MKDFLDPHQREQRILAPYAMFSRDSQGRIRPEPEHPYRGPFQRDRDRILHSSAYRRLSGKMQVFTGEMGDYHRTRLTHTQEVATIARTVGRTLGLNEDLIEALALMHDIGHPPYGHAGEDALSECIQDLGGFSHNQFALTIVQELEYRHSDCPGLNLTRECLQGQTHRIDKDPSVRPLLEVQLVDAADSVTYDAHDTDDALKLGLVSLEEMTDECELMRQVMRHVKKHYTNLTDSFLRQAVVHRLVETLVSDLQDWSQVELVRHDFATAQAAQSSDFLIGPSPEIADHKKELERFLYHRVYRHPRLLQIRTSAQQRLRIMYEAFVNDPTHFPPKYQQRAERIGVRRMAIEYLAGMTDQFCELTFERIQPCDRKIPE